MLNIQSIYNLLNASSKASDRATGIRLANEIEDLSLLIMPPAPPPVWECCAEILYNKSDAELEPYLDSLLEWLYDLNWPGAGIILDRLKKIPGRKMIVPFLNAYKKGENESEIYGAKWHCNLSELLENTELKDSLDIM